MTHDLYRDYNRGPSSTRLVRVHLYCTNEACAHATESNPIEGIASLGSWWEPPTCGPEVCPECGNDTDIAPPFATEEEP
jgi:hypothetical protein